MLYNVHAHAAESPSALQFTIKSIHQHFENIPASIPLSLGLHPWYLQQQTLQSQMELLQQAITKSNVLAIGECGLDKVCTTPWAIQENAFEQQITLAETHKLPLVIHCVRAFDETLAMLKGTQVPVVFHGVNNKWAIVERVLSRGYYVSFGKALITQNQASLDALKRTPLSHLLLETDDMVSISIADVYKKAIELLDVAENDFVLQLESNFKKVFNI